MPKSKKIIPTKLNALSLIVALTFFANISVFQLGLGNIYYGVMIAVLLILLVKSKNVRVNPWFIFLILAAFLSIYFNEIPSFFQPYQRFAVFVVLLALLSPLLTSIVLRKFRHALLFNLSVINVVLITSSFLGIAIGLPLMIGRGGYTGFFSHSMILGPMSVISMFTCLYFGDIKTKKSYRIACYALAAMAFVVCIAAGSRGALIAGVAGGLIYYYKLNQGKILSYIKVIFVVIILGLTTYPLWSSYTTLLFHKMEYASANDSMLYTRQSLWGSRLNEFENSPIYGIGFASVDTSNTHGFDSESGKIEPGSSWLAVLSMVGVLGAIPILVVLFAYSKLLYKTKLTRYKLSYLLALLSFFVIHMITEGYIFSAGSGLFLLFWLIVGNVELYYNHYKKKKVFI